MDAEKLYQLKEDRGPVLVEFYASWCPHCQRMMPIVDEVKAELEGTANVYQFDIDENGDFADKLGVTSIPTFIVFNNGEETWRHTGEIPGEALIAQVREAIG